eukprot:7254907-Prymnesium_polylepis.1
MDYSGTISFLEQLRPMPKEERAATARRSWELLVASCACHIREGTHAILGRGHMPYYGGGTY